MFLLFDILQRIHLIINPLIHYLSIASNKIYCHHIKSGYAVHNDICDRLFFTLCFHPILTIWHVTFICNKNKRPCLLITFPIHDQICILSLIVARQICRP